MTDHSYLSQTHLLVISVTNSPADMLSPLQMKDEILPTSVCITAPVLSVVSNVNVSHLCKTQDRSSPDSDSDRNEQKNEFSSLLCVGVTNKDKLFTISLKTKAGPLESDILYYLNWARGLRVDLSNFCLIELRTTSRCGCFEREDTDDDAV